MKVTLELRPLGYSHAPTMDDPFDRTIIANWEVVSHNFSGPQLEYADFDKIVHRIKPIVMNRVIHNMTKWETQ